MNLVPVGVIALKFVLIGLFSTHLYKKHGLSNVSIYKLTLRYKIHIYIVYKRFFAYITRMCLVDYQRFNVYYSQSSLKICDKY